MWPGNQHHARANRDEAQHGAELEPDGDRADGACEQRGGEGLHESVAAHPSQPPAETGARAGAERDQDQAERVGRAEDHTERRGSSGRHRRETRDGDGWKARDRFECRSRRFGIETTVADLVDHAHCRGDLAHVYAHGLHGDDLVA